jgi:two-component system NtrC family sensor kinase
MAATSIVPTKDLQKESPALAGKAFIQFIETPKARVREDKEETDGMVLKAANPIFNDQDQLIGVIYGGILLNRDYEIVDKIKQTIFEDLQYRGKDIGTATIFQDDVRISTNVRNQDGSRAIGTRVSEDVYNQIVNKGKPWIGRAYVVNNWYITAYKPIRDLEQNIIGILYVGILEQKYLDVKRNMILIFLAITVVGALISMAFSYFISRRISGSINTLVSASREFARGNLNTKVEINSNDELQDLAENFNLMALRLKERDEKLKEFTRKKIMESERLALVGQLSANVAHELNNPLQGIIAYSHLLLEKMQCEDGSKEPVQKIVIQANRCRDIIRGLLDFSRQRKPQKTLCNINAVLLECISLVENQALFHNIRIVKDFDNNLPMVIIDPSQIERVFLNLIVNAAEAMDGNGQLTLTTKFEPGQDFIEMEFRDTGPGIAEENMEKIFDPFFTTKETGHGVGLGLAISYGIVKEHKGSISVQSKLGKGTTFYVRLPLREAGDGRKNENQLQNTYH